MNGPLPTRRLVAVALCAALLAAGPVGCDRDGPAAPTGARSGDRVGDVRTQRTPTPTALLRDAHWVFEGYTPRWIAAKKAREKEAHRYTVPRDLPAVDFASLRRVMLSDGEPVVPENIRALEGKRVRLRGWALPLRELAGARSFVLHDLPFVRCVHVATPATNRQVLVELAEGATFDFTDAPLMVEGVLELGRFETFEAGDIALYALRDARVEALPLTKKDMVIGFEHDEAAHEGEVRIPARKGALRHYDPGDHGHEGH